MLAEGSKNGLCTSFDAVRAAFDRAGEVQSLRLRLGDPAALATLNAALAGIVATPLLAVSEAELYAAQAGRTEICRKLVEAGASIDDANLTGETPLALARGHADTEEYLKGLGARANTAEAAASTQDYV